MISRHVIYCDHYPDGAGEAGSNARERKPATVSHEIALLKWQTNKNIVFEDCWFAVQLSRRIWGKSRSYLNVYIIYVYIIYYLIK